MADRVRVSPFEQFVKFGTDAYGLERLLRLLQSLTTLLLFTPTLHHLLPPLTSTTTTLTLTLTHLRKRLGTLRQPFRTFRFLDSFSSAWSLFTAPPPSPSPHHNQSLVAVERWMDFASRSFTGMYMLLESLTFVEVALEVPVFSTREQVAGMVVDGQKFWFAGLVCAVVAGGVRVASGKGGWRVWRRLVADGLDLAVPGSVVGWVGWEPVTVGWCMLGSTVLTGWEVWERCGREVAAAKKAAGAVGR